MPLVALGSHSLRGIAAPCEVFALPEKQAPIS
jgi:adenylate cyclase